MSIASDFKDFSPEIQAMIIQALPEITGFLDKSNQILKDAADKVIESDEKSTSELNSLYEKGLDQIGEELKNENLDPEERKQLRCDRMKILEDAKETNEKQRDFKGKILGWIGKGIGIAALTVTVGFLGNKVTGSLPWNKDQ